MMVKWIKCLTICSITLGCELAHASPQDPISDSDWLLSNMAHYRYTALVEIGTGYRQDRYNLLSYIKPLSTYRYQAKIIEVYQGDKTISPTCIIETLETKAPTTTALTGRRLVSFDEANPCIVVDVSVYPLATPTLIDLAKKPIQNAPKP